MSNAQSKKRREILKAGSIGIGVMVAGCSGGPEEGGENGQTEDSSVDTTSEVSSGETPEGQETLLVGVNGRINNIDPAYANLTPVKTWKHLVYNGLVGLTIDDNGEYQYYGDLANEYEFIEEDGESILQFVLRDGIEFHNGDPLDAELVKAELDYWLENGAPNLEVFSALDHVTIDNESTVNCHLVHEGIAWADFSEEILIGNPYVREEMGQEDFTQNPVGAGTGPYKYVDRVEGDHITLEKNDNYHDPTGENLPHFEEAQVRVIPEQSARITQMQTNQVHLDHFISIFDWNSHRDEQGLKGERKQPGTLFPWSGLNHEVEPLGDVRVRRALSQSINRQQFIQAAYGSDFGLPTTTHAPPGSYYHFEELEQRNMHDPDSARQLLEDAGYEDGFEFNMYVPNREPELTYFQVLQSMWKEELNVDVVPDQLEYSTMYGNISAGDDSYESHLTDYKSQMHPLNVIRVVLREDASIPAARGWYNEEFETLVAELEENASRMRESEDLLRGIFEILTEDVPALFYASVDETALMREELQGFWFGPRPNNSREALRDLHWEG